MLRYKTKTRPGLVALYDIRPGNGAGPFLQPRSPHGAVRTNDFINVVTLKSGFWPGFQGHDIYEVEYWKNSAS